MQINKNEIFIVLYFRLCKMCDIKLFYIGRVNSIDAATDSPFDWITCLEAVQIMFSRSKNSSLQKPRKLHSLEYLKWDICEMQIAVMQRLWNMHNCIIYFLSTRKCRPPFLCAGLPWQVLHLVGRYIRLCTFKGVELFLCLSLVLHLASLLIQSSSKPK